MGERKVINKYIPADFDPSLVPRGKKLSSKDGTVPVRMMLPFSMQCSNCGEFLPRGRKFNSRKEPVQGPDGRYLGIQRFRFYIKCNRCSRPISFLTDPKNADYEMENGATRNFEMYRNTTKEQDEDEADDKGGGGKPGEKEDAMKALEERVLDSKREMEDLDNLEEIKAMNARHLRIDPLEALQLEEIKEGDYDRDELLTAEDEELIQSIRFGKKSGGVKRLTKEDEALLDEQRQKQREQIEQQRKQQSAAAAKEKSRLPVMVVKKKKRRQEQETTNNKNTAATMTKKAKSEELKQADSGGLSSLLGGYGSDSS